MAHASSQPLTVFSRDLKYMLDAKYSAAPLHRKLSGRATVILSLISLALAVWLGMRMLPVTGGVAPESNATFEPPRRAAQAHVNRSKYTQTEHPVSKSSESGHESSAPSAEPPVVDDGTVRPDLKWETYSVRRGDTLGKIFQRQSIEIGLASRIVKHETGQILKKLLPEHQLRFGFGNEGRLAELSYELSRWEEVHIQFKEDGHFDVTKRRIPTETRENTASQTIGSSLFVSASRAGLSDRLIMQLVSIFGWDIDFALDIRSGDRFSIIYEEMYRNGEPFGTGDIVAAEFVNNGTVFHAVRHIDGEGRKEYYDLEGNNLRGTFLKTPMKISRITSGFSKSRYHPVLKKWRAHRGVDYGAPAGTPILATGDGRVHFVGRNGGYGNTVILKHGGQYSTLYAHLSRYSNGIKRGAQVRQGVVIGHVGSTGLATGPHLHYEFRVNGQHRNPLTYETPKAQPIAERYREPFLVMARERISRITETQPAQVASR